MARKNQAEIVLTARDRTKSAFRSVNQGLGRIAAIGIAGAVAGTVLLTRESLKLIDALAKESQLLGITTEKLAAMKLQASKAGVETKTLEKSLVNVTRVVAEAADGTGLAVDTLKKLGLEARDLAQQSPDEQFKQIAEAMKGLNTQSEKVLASYELFGGRGAALLRVLDQGAAGFEDAERKVKLYGTAISAVDAASIEEANDATTDLREAFKGLGFDLARRVAPGLKSTNEGLTGFVVTLRRDAIPAMILLAERFAGIEASARSLSDIELAIRVEMAADDMAEVERAMLENEDRVQKQLHQIRNVADAERRKILEEEIRKTINSRELAEKEAIEARLAEVVTEQERRAQIILDADANLAEQRRLAANEARETRLEEERIAEEEVYLARLEAQVEHDAEIEEMRKKASQRLLRIAVAEGNEFVRQKKAQQKLEERAAQNTIRLRQATAQTSIQILQQLAGKNKNVARALFLVEKGLAIARTVQNTAAASVKALAELGPIAGPPAAAAITAYGAAQVGLIAATALTGVGSIGGGGASIGGGGSLAGGGNESVAPVEDGLDRGQGIEDQGTVQLIFPSLFGITPEAVDALADALREASENRDVIVVAGQGRNAELLAGANG